jgi:hypothetical protein
LVAVVVAGVVVLVITATHNLVKLHNHQLAAASA